jgi:hypothetical protein
MTFGVKFSLELAGRQVPMLSRHWKKVNPDLEYQGRIDGETRPRFGGCPVNHAYNLGSLEFSILISLWGRGRLSQSTEN